MTDYTEPSCSKALGMESGDIKDDQITASSSRTSESSPHRARLNNDLAGRNHELVIFVNTIRSVTSFCLGLRGSWVGGFV